MRDVRCYAPLNNLPPSLIVLHTPYHYSHPLTNLPSSITELNCSKLDHSFTSFPSSLTNLSFSYSTQVPIEFLPSTLKSLSFLIPFNTPLISTNGTPPLLLCTSLTQLTFQKILIIQFMVFFLLLLGCV